MILAQAGVRDAFAVLGRLFVPVTCGACGALYEPAAWARLALARRIEAHEVSRMLVRWSEEFCVEVRSCRSCGREIATKRHAHSPCPSQEEAP
jgi:hypothetical protein